MKKKNKDLATMERWLDKVSSSITATVVQALRTQTDIVGPEYTKELAFRVLLNYVGDITLTCLQDTKGKSTKDALSNFGHDKTRIQAAIAAGFEEAMSQFSRQPCEYYCQIKMVPEPESDAVN